MAGVVDVGILIDAFLGSDKTLGRALTWWERDSEDRCQRWTQPVEVNGEQPGIALVAKAYNQTSLKFRILLVAPRCIWRLDFEDDEHINSLDAPDGPGLIIRSPHYHSWADNRHLAKPNSLPAKLPNARVLPPAIRSFDNAFWWFCAQTRISITSGDVPALPKKETLL